MKLIKIVPILVILLIGVVYSCDSDMEFIEEANSINNIDQRPVRSKDPSGGGGVNLNLVDLGSAENFAILSKTAITNVTTSSIIGDVGASPITGAALLIDCSEVQGIIYTTDGAGQSCPGQRLTNGPLLTLAVVDMEAAYVEAAGRPNPIQVNLGGGSIGGDTLIAGVYKWTTDLEITTDITLSGSSNDVWIFQVAGKINMAAAMTINLAGANAENIFWQSAGDVTLGTSSNFEGTILGMKSISLLTGASLNGRVFSQTAAVLQQCSITKP
jgi:hypothetical protein